MSSSSELITEIEIKNTGDDMSTESDVENLSRELSEERKKVKFYKHRAKLQEAIKLEKIKQVKALTKENESYKKAVDTLSAENSKHKKQLKRLMNKG